MLGMLSDIWWVLDPVLLLTISLQPLYVMMLGLEGQFVHGV